jgi:RNA polymerase primary sigma factor
MDRLRRAADRLTQALGRDATAEELAYELGTTPQRVGRLERLNRPVRPANGLGPVAMPDRTSNDLVLAALRVDLYAMLAHLSARERRVLRLRYGLVDGRRCSLEEIGRRLGIPRLRVRQIDRDAHDKLRRETGAPGLGATPE